MRIEGWEKSLDLYIQGVSEKTFKWGACDCLLFVSDACVISCGVDPMSKKKKDDPETIRGKYDSKETAGELIKKYRKTKQGIMDIHFNRVDIAFAQRGDIVLNKLNEGWTFGLVWGGKAFFKSENEGFITRPLSECKYAWRVE